MPICIGVPFVCCDSKSIRALGTFLNKIFNLQDYPENGNVPLGLLSKVCHTPPSEVFLCIEILFLLQ